VEKNEKTLQSLLSENAEHDEVSKVISIAFTSVTSAELFLKDIAACRAALYAFGAEPLNSGS